MIELELSNWMASFIHFCILVVFVIGLLCFFLRKRYIRQLVGLKLMLQSVSLGLILTGWERGELYLSQSMVISALVIEAVVIGLALTMIIHMAKHAQNEKTPIEEAESKSIS
ncbi:MAG: NADH-quinone oxidoreductase subunit K [Chloroflexota bacterium]|nr:NADH-quinone oxidoreductase subunit K [Chloroflexota bacterium]